MTIFIKIPVYVQENVTLETFIYLTDFFTQLKHIYTRVLEYWKWIKPFWYCNILAILFSLQIPPIHQKRIVTFVNYFIIDTVSFLNNFINASENTLWKLEKRMRKLDTTLKLLESKVFILIFNKSNLNFTQFINIFSLFMVIITVEFYTWYCRNWISCQQSIYFIRW